MHIIALGSLRIRRLPTLFGGLVGLWRGVPVGPLRVSLNAKRSHSDEPSPLSDLELHLPVELKIRTGMRIVDITTMQLH